MMKMLVGLAALSLGSVGCSDEAPAPTAKADLPEGWANASPVNTFTQGSCTGSAYDPNVHEMLDVTTTPGLVTVGYHNAHFRCEQAVEGFFRTSSTDIELLVQPVDMNPASFAACDCLYEITAELAVRSGTYSVGVFRRWDHKSGSDGLTSVGTMPAEVP